MSRCILSSVGTSLLTNRAPRELTELLRNTANLREADLPPEARAAIEGRVAQACSISWAASRAFRDT